MESSTAHNLKAGDVCLDCQELGLKKHLRYFKLNLKGDTLLKCESDECMFPYNDEIYTSSDEEIENDEYIDDFIQQNEKDNKKENDLPKNYDFKESLATDEFDLSFLSNFQEQNFNKQDLSEETVENIKENDNLKDIANELISNINSNDNPGTNEFSLTNRDVLDHKNTEYFKEFYKNDVSNQDFINETVQKDDTKEIEYQFSLLTNPSKENLHNIEFSKEIMENIKEDLKNQEFGNETIKFIDQKQNINEKEPPLKTTTNSKVITKTEFLTTENMEFNNEHFNIQDFRLEEVEYIEQKENVTTNFNENLQNTEYSLQNLEFLDYKEIENINENHMITIPSLDYLKYEITTTAVVENNCKLNHDNKEIISFISVIDEPSKQTNIIKENDKQIFTFTTSSNDSIKDCKPKIDIQSIETIKIDESLYNTIPNLTNSQTSEIPSEHSTNSTTKVSKKRGKYKTRTKTDKKSLQNSTKTSNTCAKIPKSKKLTTETSNSSKTLESNCTSSSNTLPSSNTSLTSASTSDIPKANILKGAELLKKFALAQDITPKLNTKMKAARNKKLVSKESPPQRKVQEPKSAPPPSQNNESDLSLDNIAEILIANKMKRENK